MQFHLIASIIIFNALGALGVENDQNKLCGMVKGNESLTNGREFNLDVLGYDYEGLPIVVMNLGHYDNLWLVEHPWELDIFERNYAQFVKEAVNSGDFFKRFINRSEPLDYHVTIMDFDGFDVRHNMSEKVLKFLLKFFTTSQPLYGKISYGYMVNANPVADQVIHMAKPLIGPLLEKVEIFGTNKKKWIPQILKKIPRDQLPPKYGGVEDFKMIARCDLV